MAELQNAPSPLKRLGWLLGHLGLAGLGFLIYRLLEPRIHIDLSDQVAPTMFAFAGVVGVFAGFVATAVIFIAGASGPTIERMRRDHGTRLTNALLGSVIALFISAIGLAICGLFANGWGAKGAACALLLLPMLDLVLVLAALKTAMNSGSEKRRQPQDESTV